MLLIAFGLRLYLCSIIPGYTEDHIFFIGWMKTLNLHGLGHVYAESSTLNYPPVFPFLLKIYDILLHFLGIQPEPGGISTRIPSILIDMIAMLFISRMFAQIDPKRRWIGLAFVAFNPALLVVGAVWGQIDMLHSFLMVASIYTLGKKNYLAGILFALALLTKFQAIILLPVISIYLLKLILQSKTWKDAFAFSTGFLSLILVVCGYFYTHGNLKVMLEKAYLHAVDMYPFLTLNAMNIWYHLVGTDPWTNDYTEILPHFTLKYVGYILLAISVCWICYHLYQEEKITFPILLKSSAAVSFSFYMLATQMHERYIIPTVLFLSLLVLYESKWIKAAVALSLTTCFNLILVMNDLMSVEPTMWMVYVNTASFLWMMASLSKMEWMERLWMASKKRKKTESISS
jgi:Gpi18-like mannosyltransferase